MSLEHLLHSRHPSQITTEPQRDEPPGAIPGLAKYETGKTGKEAEGQTMEEIEAVPFFSSSSSLLSRLELSDTTVHEP